MKLDAVRCSNSLRSLAHAMAGRARVSGSVSHAKKALCVQKDRKPLHVFFSIEDPSDIMQHEQGAGEDSAVR